MKEMEELYREMLAEFQRLTGTAMTGESDLAVRLYAVAAQVHALYVQSDWVTRQCFPQTATGEWLDQHAQLRGVERREAAAAEGIIRFFLAAAAETGVLIPAGTVCMTAGLIRFETLEDATVPAGSLQVDVPARAVETGSGGNVGAETVTMMALPPVGVSRCSNPQAFTGGSAAETDEELRTRVLETFRRMPNGANAAFYEQGAMSFEEVAAAAVLPRSRGVGTVDVVISTRQGLPGEDLLEEVRAYFQLRREIAVDVQVKAPTPREVAVSVQVAPAQGYSMEEAKAGAKAAVESWFDGTRLGQSVLRAELSGRVFSVPAVGNCTVTAPQADVVLQPQELPRLSGVTVEEMP